MTNGKPKLSYILESPASYSSFSEFTGDVRAIGRLGYAGVELQMQTPGDLESREFANLLADCNLRLAGFQTGSAYLQHGVCLASPDAAVRRAATDLLKRYVDFAQPFGAVVVLGLLQGSYREEPDRERARGRIWEHLREIAAYAEKAEAVMAFEPVNRYECSVFHNTVADVLSCVQSVNSPSLRAMVDTFHVNIEEIGQDEAIRAASPALAHVHLSETNRGLFGSGHLDLPLVFRALRDVSYSGFASVGVYRDEPSVAERARHSMEQLRELLTPRGVF